MSHRISISLAWALALAVAACGQTGPASSPNPRAQRVAQLDRIASSCGLLGALRLVGSEEVRFKPSPGADYEDVDCVLVALKKADIPMKLGLVANEILEDGSQR